MRNMNSNCHLGMRFYFKLIKIWSQATLNDFVNITSRNNVFLGFVHRLVFRNRLRNFQKNNLRPRSSENVEDTQELLATEGADLSQCTVRLFLSVKYEYHSQNPRDLTFKIQNVNIKNTLMCEDVEFVRVDHDTFECGALLKRIKNNRTQYN